MADLQNEIGHIVYQLNLLLLGNEQQLTDVLTQIARSSSFSQEERSKAEKRLRYISDLDRDMAERVAKSNLLNQEIEECKMQIASSSARVDWIQKIADFSQKIIENKARLKKVKDPKALKDIKENISFYEKKILELKAKAESATSVSEASLKNKLYDLEQKSRFFDKIKRPNHLLSEKCQNILAVLPGKILDSLTQSEKKKLFMLGISTSFGFELDLILNVARQYNLDADDDFFKIIDDYYQKNK